MDEAVFNQRAAAYARMADILCHLGDTWRDWPDLSQLAKAAGLSPSHFQREFSAWAGVSPRQYQAMIAHGEAGDLLRQGASVLDTAHETGFSGPSRLHDLFIAHEGLTPGEAKSGGSGVDLTIGRAPTPFGDGVWLFNNRGLVALGFVDEGAPERTGFEHQGRGEDAAFADLTGRYPKASIKRDDTEASAFARRVFVGNEALPIALYGTPYRRQIWRALVDIPVGGTETYGQLAARAGNPKAARAVGAAVGANPISWFIPCHRALAADGRLHNYHWGVARKRAMLIYERAHAA